MKITGREGRDPAETKLGHRGGGLAPHKQIIGSSGVIQEYPPGRWNLTFVYTSELNCVAWYLPSYPGVCQRPLTWASFSVFIIYGDTKSGKGPG